MKMTATAKFRMNPSLHHMMAACHFASSTGDIERQHQGEELGPFYDEIVMHASSAIIIAVAYLESFINEVFLLPLPFRVADVQ
jgi:hypothetical protein